MAIILGRKEFTKTGETVLNLNIDGDILHVEPGETKTLNCILENTFNLKVDLIDDVQSNFTLETTDTGIININDKTVTGKAYGKVPGIVTHKPTGKKREITIAVVKGLESIVQGVRDTDLPDGNYDILVKDEIYPIEMINVYPENGEDTIRYSLEEGQSTRLVSLGDSSSEHKTLIVKYHGNLKVDAGVTITANTVGSLTYKKGMYLCVLGNICNDGNITMTARGTYNAAGQNVYLWKNINDSFEYVPKIGAAGGAAQQVSSVANGENSRGGLTGETGTNRALGGGGSGALTIWRYVNGVIARTAAGGTATSYSGGPGSRCSIYS